MQSGGWQHHEGLPEAAPLEASFHAGDGWAGSGTLPPLPGGNSEAAGSGGSAASSQHPGCEDGPLFDSDTPQVTGNYRCSEITVPRASVPVGGGINARLRSNGRLACVAWPVPPQCLSPLACQAGHACPAPERPGPPQVQPLPPQLWYHLGTGHSP